MTQQFIYVALGGAIGACLRFGITFFLFNTSFPWATFVANFLGCLIIGILLALMQSSKINTSIYLLLATGLCGGFTTFSTFSAENILFLQQQKWLTFALYTLSTFIVCLLATYLGWRIATNK
jgi:CrcB protein